jgi:hypothetical protein
MLGTCLNIKICWFLKDSIKKPFSPKRPPPQNTFSLKFQMFDIFLVLKQEVTLLKYKYLKTEEKIN